MERVNSADGTPIAFSRSGRGPLLLLLHGATADHTTTWRSVLTLLETHFTVCAMDRRGRGASGDSPHYELAREAQDVAAVVTALGDSVNVLGHSYGALCALEGALHTPGIRKLALYEGVSVSGADIYPSGLIERLEAMLAAGENERALVTMLRELVDMPPEEIDLMRAQTAAWQRRLINVTTLPREAREDSRYVFDGRRFRNMLTPTLLLVGEESPPRELANARAVAAALPDGRVAILPGQQHIAMHTAPDLFVREVVSFLTE